MVSITFIGSLAHLAGPRPVSVEEMRKAVLARAARKHRTVMGSRQR